MSEPHLWSLCTHCGRERWEKQPERAGLCGRVIDYCSFRGNVLLSNRDQGKAAVIKYLSPISTRRTTVSSGSLGRKGSGDPGQQLDGTVNLGKPKQREASSISFSEE